MNNSMIASNVKGFSFIGLTWVSSLAIAGDILQFLLVAVSLVAAIFLGLYNREKYRNEKADRINKDK